VLVSQLVVRDLNGVWADESAYLTTLREGRIVRDGVFPFNLRWLVPLVAGPGNLFPVDGADAIKAINFGALVATAVYLVLLLVRLRVPLVLALAAPVFLLCSYLGVYAGTNRLVLDPFNYALFVVLFHTLLQVRHWPWFGVALLVASLNSEKAIVWIPVFVVVALLRGRRAIETAKLALAYCGPTILYFIAMALYLQSSRSESHAFVQNLHVMSLTPLGATISDATVRLNTFQMLWFPFGAFTIYALLGFATCLRERWLAAFALLVIPIAIQILIASDAQRMAAYGFVVYLPFGFLYLTRVVADVPRLLSTTLIGLAVGLAIVQFYVLPELRYPNLVRLILSAIELAIVAAIVFVHSTFYRGGQKSTDARASTAAPTIDRAS
jgi:hypothetical protein